VIQAEEARAATTLDPRPPSDSPGLSGRFILGMRVDPSSYPDATETIVRWAAEGGSRYVCIANVHMVMEAHDDPSFQDVVNGADFVTSDGMPLVWALRLKGSADAERVYGPDLTPLVCAAAAAAGIPVGFFGADPHVREAMVERLRQSYPQLHVAYSYSPPFREATPAEEAETARAINASGARILFVGLGCPKQERWMARNVGSVDCVMLGVGAAFDFIAGTKRKAPPFLQRIGLEWLFRVITEPKRLWRRYLYNNPRFVVLLAAELMGRGR
jgi:N-acetylglucosaminyldiphosphoundecaprenol N-acetyl-beta-D-mannosaminyltransferase